MSGLTEEQRAVSEAPVGARQLVVRGQVRGRRTRWSLALPTSLRRKRFFGERSAAELLRAAVNELRHPYVPREMTHADRAECVRLVRNSVLANVDPDGEWTTKSFDGRDGAAIGKIAQIGESLDEVKHVVVDELQDLVGVRMRFVRALLKEFDAGFTLLGDPAQGIYDFSLEDEADPEVDGSPALYS